VTQPNEILLTTGYNFSTGLNTALLEWVIEYAVYITLASAISYLYHTDSIGYIVFVIHYSSRNL